jgi:hypothetical protein
MQGVSILFFSRAVLPQGTSQGHCRSTTATWVVKSKHAPKP